MTDVLLLPGIIAPAAMRYDALVSHLDGINVTLKDLEVYRDESPPTGYSITTEIDSVERAVNELGLDRGRSCGCRCRARWSFRPRPRWTTMQARLEILFDDFTGEVYQGLHHLNTSHQAEPARVAAALRALWARASA